MADGSANDHRWRLHNRRQVQRAAVRAAADHMLAMMDLLGSRREFRKAKEKIEEAVMWADRGLFG